MTRKVNAQLMSTFGDLLRKRAGLSARVDAMAREITPAVERYLAGTSSRKRSRSPSREEEEEEEEEEVPRAVGPSVFVPHSLPARLQAPAAADTYVSIEEAFDDTLEIAAFYRRRLATAASRTGGCFLCEYGNKTYDNSPDFGCRPYVLLLRLISVNYAFMSLECLGELCQAYYERTIVRPMAIYIERHNLDPLEYALPPMSAAAFATHIKWHNFNPVIMIGESLRDTTRMIEVVKNRTIRREKDEVDPKMVDAYTKLVKTQLALMNTKRENLFFNTTSGESLELDPAKLSTLGNMRRVESLLANTRNTIGGQTATDSSVSVGDAHRTNFVPEVHTTVASTVANSDLDMLGDIVRDSQPDAMDIDG